MIYYGGMRRKLNKKNPYVAKRIKENPVIKKKDFEELLRRAVRVSTPSPRKSG
jgi:hypothetical protein